MHIYALFSNHLKEMPFGDTFVASLNLSTPASKVNVNVKIRIRISFSILHYFPYCPYIAPQVPSLSNTCNSIFIDYNS